MFNSDESCWEQVQWSPCCCVPIHVTCDFCALYIEHRREITEDAPTPTTNHFQPRARRARRRGCTAAHLRQRRESNDDGEITINVPDLWADHHVLKVRAALARRVGVQDVIASSAFRSMVAS